MKPPRWQNENTDILRKELIRRVEERSFGKKSRAWSGEPGDHHRGAVRVAIALVIALSIIIPASYFALTNAPRPGDIGSEPLVSPVSSPSVSANHSSPKSSPAHSANQCADSVLTVTLGAAAGTAGALHANVVFTNTGTTSCILRGAPGVSVVGEDNGKQLGVPAARDQSASYDVTLAAHGGKAHAPLEITDIRQGVYAPAGCKAVMGNGYRVYPPHSTRAYYVPQNEVYACSGSPVFLHVGVVSSGAK